MGGRVQSPGGPNLAPRDHPYMGVGALCWRPLKEGTPDPPRKGCGTHCLQVTVTSAWAQNLGCPKRGFLL